MNYLKVGDVAAELGVSEQAVRLWCRQGILPARRPAGTRKWLISPADLDAWVKQEPVQTVLDSLHAPYRDHRPDQVIVAESTETLTKEDAEEEAAEEPQSALA